MKPHQAEVKISYDGTVVETSTVAAGGSAGGFSYTVVKGDCLWNLAKRFYGNGAKYMIIYNANVDVIESAARAHGKVNSYKGSTAGWWIWPGEILFIPGADGGQSSAQTTVTRRVGEANPKLGEMMTEQATAFSYTDVASGESDRVSITVKDIDKEWMGKLMPRRGASLGARIILTNWGDGEGTDGFDCGVFLVDDISFSGRPLKCVLGGVSVPVMDDFKALPNTNTWEKTTIQDIAAQIPGKAGISLYYEADTVQIAEIEQSRQTDSAFLYSVCEKYGLCMKVYSQKVVIFDIVKYEEKEAAASLDETDMISWSYNTTVDGTYTGVNLDYTDPDMEDSIHVMMGSPGRMYAINTQASSQYDAEMQAAAKVNAANRNVETLKCKIRAKPGLIASQCVDVSGLGKADGKYFIDRIEHSLGSGYTMDISAHKVQVHIKATAPVSLSGGGKSYTVVSGDTLWGISKRFYGTGTKYYLIYDANAELIESTARAHGKSSSDNGHWIWPGEILTIPEG